MTEKKSVKSIIFVVVIVALIAMITLLSIIVYKLVKENEKIAEELKNISNKINNNIAIENNSSDTPNIEEKIENITNSEVEENSNSIIVSNDEQNTKKVTLSQLSGDFYKIEEITKEEREIRNVKNYKDFEFDLDNDGEIDKIKLRHVVKEDEEENSYDRTYYTLEYNGNVIYERWEGYGKVGIVDLDESDDFLEVWVYDDGPSDDPCYIFFRKVGNELIELGCFDVDIGFYADGKGKVLAANRLMPWIEPRVFDSYHTIENNKFIKHELDFSYNKNFEYTSKDLYFTTDLENLEKFENDKSQNDESQFDITPGEAITQKAERHNIYKLDENTKFKIIEFVKRTNEYESQNLKIELSDGRIGYLIHPYGVFYIFD